MWATDLLVAVAASPLPMAGLAHGKPVQQAAVTPGFVPGEFEALLLAGNKVQAALVPNARFSVAAESGHDVNQDQPELVIVAIRQVVEGARNPAAWAALASCCED